MSYKTLTIVLVIFVSCFVFTKQDVAIDRMEKECIHQGGMCVRSDDCPSGSLSSVKGLCPRQQHLGVECCYGLPLSEKICNNRGGECMDQCSTRETDLIAEDCPLSQKCCILI